MVFETGFDAPSGLANFMKRRKAGANLMEVMFVAKSY
jgi:hypothetical protein